MGFVNVYTDAECSDRTDRPVLTGALNYLRSGDQLIVVSMDRLARSLIDLHQLVDKLMLGLPGSVAEFERVIIRERQAEGIARVKARGAYKGRAKALSDERLAHTRRWVGEGIPKADVARRLNVGRTTLSIDTVIRADHILFP